MHATKTSRTPGTLRVKRNVNLVGTIRKNRRELPRALAEIKLKCREVIAGQNQEGIHVLKWKDKRAVLMLSTCHDDKAGDLGKLSVLNMFMLAYTQSCIVHFQKIRQLFERERKHCANSRDFILWG